ncbi:hypothetical protein [Streptomyces luteireticuli]|uniref:Heavy metal transporter n=1 Tax=Streptomyces luteireticuli TaxID=173858 RepID=A0ABP3I626_9ACTN
MSPIFPVRRGRLLRIGAACAVLLALIGYAVAYFLTGGPGAPRCTASADGESYSLDPEQAGNASTITAVGTSRGLPERAVTIALATAMQESGLRNIHHGDRDSLGLFQQRPTQGWGTARQITDPVYAAGAFYDHLVRVPGYSRLPLTVAAQRVQHSGFPQAYAKHEPGASLLAAALTGRTPAAFSCSTSPSDGKPGDPSAVRAGLRRDFGPSVLPATGVSGDGKNGTNRGNGGKSDGKDAAASRTVSVPPRPVPTAAPDNGPRRRGWELASWAVAHAAELRVERVSFDGRVWTAEQSRDGWRRGAGRTDEGPAAVRITTAQ